MYIDPKYMFNMLARTDGGRKSRTCFGVRAHERSFHFGSRFQRRLCAMSMSTYAGVSLVWWVGFFLRICGLCTVCPDNSLKPNTHGMLSS